MKAKKSVRPGLALPPARGRASADWPEKIATAIQARTDAQKARKGKPTSFESAYLTR